MKYYVHITSAADRDMESAASYILYTLKNPIAASALLQEAEATVNSLDLMPNRYPFVDDKMLASLGIRFVQVKNYLVFYTVSAETNTVHIIRFLYGKSDWAFILRGSYIPEA